MHLFNGAASEDVLLDYCFEAPSPNEPEGFTRDLEDAFVNTDYVEVRHGPDAAVALNGLQLGASDVRRFAAGARGQGWVIVMEEAFGGLPFSLNDTPKVAYLGHALVDWR